MAGDRAQDRRASIAYAAERISSATAFVVVAGRGVTKDSSLAAPLNDSDLWAAFPGLERTNVRLKQLMSFDNFESNAYRAWGFYGYRLALSRKAAPHRGLCLLADWAREKPGGYTIFTTSTEGQFIQSGFAAERVHEYFGSIHHLQCSRRCTEKIWPAERLQLQISEADCEWLGDLPTCPHCGAVARPNVEMYGDCQFATSRTDLQERSQAAWISQMGQPLVIEIGVSKEDSAAHSFSQFLRQGRGGFLIRIDPINGAENDDADVVIDMTATNALEAIDRLLKRQSRSPQQTLQGRNSRLPPSRQKEGRQSVEQTLRRRLALLALLPEHNQTGINVDTLIERLQSNGYQCVRRTVERDLRELGNAEVWRNAGIEISSRIDILDSRTKLWTRKGTQQAVTGEAMFAGLVQKQLQILPLDMMQIFPPSDEPITLTLDSVPGTDGNRLIEHYQARRLSPNQRITILPHGGYRLVARVEKSAALMWMLQANAHVLEVVEPMDLREELGQFAAEAGKRYGRPTTSEK